MLIPHTHTHWICVHGKNDDLFFLRSENTCATHYISPSPPPYPPVAVSLHFSVRKNRLRTNFYDSPTPMGWQDNVAFAHGPLPISPSRKLHLFPGTRGTVQKLEHMCVCFFLCGIGIEYCFWSWTAVLCDDNGRSKPPQRDLRTFLNIYCFFLWASGYRAALIPILYYLQNNRYPELKLEL